MSDALVEVFLRDGFVKIGQAFPEDLANECADLLWAEIGYDRDDPSTWTEPVRWIPWMAQEPFRRAAGSPVLHDAFDRLVGPGRWAPRTVLGSFPLRFPHDDEPDDAGWHIEGSFLPEGGSASSPAGYHANVRSKDRALLMLFLFTEVGEDDAPTRIRVGSHLDVPPILRRFGERGASPFTIAREVDERSAHRPLTLATGRPGDVYLCHPFLVHAAQPNHGRRPRFMAQPALHPAVPLELDRPDGAYSPVEIAIRRGLGLEGSPGED